MKIPANKRKKVILRITLMLLASFLLIAVIAVVTMPVLIVLKGDKEVSICYGEEYVDAGASLKWH